MLWLTEDRVYERTVIDIARHERDCDKSVFERAQGGGFGDRRVIHGSNADADDGWVLIQRTVIGHETHIERNSSKNLGLMTHFRAKKLGALVPET